MSEHFDFHPPRMSPILRLMDDTVHIDSHAELTQLYSVCKSPTSTYSRFQHIFYFG